MDRLVDTNFRRFPASAKIAKMSTRGKLIHLQYMKLQTKYESIPTSRSQENCDEMILITDGRIYPSQYTSRYARGIVITILNEAFCI